MATCANEHLDSHRLDGIVDCWSVAKARKSSSRGYVAAVSACMAIWATWQPSTGLKLINTKANPDAAKAAAEINFVHTYSWLVAVEERAHVHQMYMESLSRRADGRGMSVTDTAMAKVTNSSAEARAFVASLSQTSV